MISSTSWKNATRTRNYKVGLRNQYLFIEVFRLHFAFEQRMVPYGHAFLDLAYVYRINHSNVLHFSTTALLIFEAAKKTRDFQLALAS